MGFGVAPGSADLRRPVLDQILKLPKTISSREEDKIEDESCSVVKPNNRIFSLFSREEGNNCEGVAALSAALHVSATRFSDMLRGDQPA